MNDPVALSRQFAIPDLVSFDAGQGGLTRINVNSPIARAEIYLHGGHVTQFVPKDRPPVLFMSELSEFRAGKAIRGGVPICFPWFGAKPDDAKAPAHGFARLMEWSVESVTSTASGIEVVLRLASSEETRKQWPADFVAKYTITVGETLQLSLAVTNTGKTPMKFAEALHTYFAVGDVQVVSIDGLEKETYFDKAGGGTIRSQGDEPIRFIRETDRIYFDTQATCTIHDPALGRKIFVEKTGSNTTVVWNPWNEKAKALADFGDDEWPGMVCVETCNVADYAVTVAPDQTHTMTAIISTTR